MKILRRFTALLLTLVLAAAFPAAAFAAQPQKIDLNVSYVNPLYADTVSEEDLLSPVSPPVNFYEDPIYTDSIAEAGQILRTQMKLREPAAVVYFHTDTADNTYLTNLCHEISNYALQHTGDPTEGDYLKWQFGGWKASVSGSGTTGSYDITITYTITHYTTLEQEETVDAAVNDLLADLDLFAAPNYEKIAGIYQYICNTVTYDHEHPEETYMLKHTAYGALIDKTAVCQGYAALLYRLALELGVDCRVIAGVSSGEHHGWNIVKLGAFYYNVDSTWDAQETDYQYFLKGDANFMGHIRFEEYTEESFLAEYPTDTADFDIEHCPHGECDVLVSNAAPATCTTPGSYDADTYCLVCGLLLKQESIVVPAGHIYDAGVCQRCGNHAVQRIYGAGRAETALEVAEALGEEKFDAIIIANGEDEKFADALTGSYLANVKGAPILLYRASGMSPLNYEYIAENLNAGGTVFLLGGEAAIPKSVETALEAYNVKRLAGATRFDTNLAILEEAGVTNEEILIARGYEFADSLSASATGLPILVVNDVTGKLTEEQAAFLETHKANKMTILGGSAGISDDLEKAIEEIVGKDLERCAGNVREATSVKIAKAYIKNPDFVVVAYSRRTPDGLCGGPLAYKLGVPLLLVNAGQEAHAAAYIAEEGIAAGYVLGGEAVLSNETVKTVFDLPENAVIGKP